MDYNHYCESINLCNEECINMFSIQNDRIDMTNLNIQDMDLTLLQNTESMSNSSDDNLDDTVLELSHDFNNTTVITISPINKEINKTTIHPFCGSNGNEVCKQEPETNERRNDINTSIFHEDFNNSYDKLNVSNLSTVLQDSHLFSTSIELYSKDFTTEENIGTFLLSANREATVYSESKNKKCELDVEDNNETKLQIIPDNDAKIENLEGSIYISHAELELLTYLYNINSYTRFIKWTTQPTSLLLHLSHMEDIFTKVKTILNRNHYVSEAERELIGRNSNDSLHFDSIMENKSENVNKTIHFCSNNFNLFGEGDSEIKPTVICLKLNQENEETLNEKYWEQSVEINGKETDRIIEETANEENHKSCHDTLTCQNVISEFEQIKQINAIISSTENIGNKIESVKLCEPFNTRCINNDTCFYNSFLTEDSEFINNSRHLLHNSLSPVNNEKLQGSNYSEELGATAEFKILPFIDKKNDTIHSNTISLSTRKTCKQNKAGNILNSFPPINSKSSWDESMNTILEISDEDQNKNDNTIDNSERNPNKKENIRKQLTVAEKNSELISQDKIFFNKCKKYAKYSKLDLKLKSLVNELQEKFKTKNKKWENRSQKKDKTVINSTKTSTNNVNDEQKFCQKIEAKFSEQERILIKKNNYSYYLRSKPKINQTFTKTGSTNLLEKKEIHTTLKPELNKLKNIKKNAEIAEQNKQKLHKLLQKRETDEKESSYYDLKNNKLKEESVKQIGNHVKYKEMKPVIKTTEPNICDKDVHNKGHKLSVIVPKQSFLKSKNLLLNSIKMEPFGNDINREKNKIKVNSFPEIKEKPFHQELSNIEKATFIKEPQIGEFMKEPPLKQKLHIRIITTNRGEQHFREIRFKSKHYLNNLYDYKFTNTDILLSRTYTSRFHRNDPKKRLARYQKHLLYKNRRYKRNKMEA